MLIKTNKQNVCGGPHLNIQLTEASAGTVNVYLDGEALIVYLY